jgi:hypothetical protein
VSVLNNLKPNVRNNLKRTQSMDNSESSIHRGVFESSRLEPKLWAARVDAVPEPSGTTERCFKIPARESSRECIGPFGFPALIFLQAGGHSKKGSLDRTKRSAPHSSDFSK